MRLKIYTDKLIRKGATVELKEVTERSLAQNNYLHLIIRWFGKEFGYHMEEAKMVYKYLNKDLYLYEKNGLSFMRSSAELSKEDLATSINKFKDYSSGLGLYLPGPEDQAYLKAMYTELKNDKYM